MINSFPRWSTFFLLLALMPSFASAQEVVQKNAQVNAQVDAQDNSAAAVPPTFPVVTVPVATNDTFHSTGADSTSASSINKLISNADHLHPWQMWLGVNYISPEIHPDSEDLSLKGFTLGGGFPWSLTFPYTTTSKLSFTYNGGSERRFRGSTDDHKMHNEIFLLSQSLNYDLYFQNERIRPFVAAGLGFGWWQSAVGAKEYYGHSPLWQLGIGAEVELQQGLMPFLQVNYRWFDIDNQTVSENGVTREQKLSEKDKWDLGGVEWMLGMGYAF